jgi:REP element-mobilizing transposase RayT
LPRPARVHVEGGIYHVYNRLGRGERVFDREQHAEAFVSLLRDLVQRDGLTIYAWCLMSNHYHLAVRTGVISLDRPLRSLQQRLTRDVNLRRRVYGPLWQGRYRAKLVEDQRYLDQLLIYIHLNPVTAGFVDDPAAYSWSGHHELMGRAKQSIVDVDEVLRVFGTNRRSARAAYVRRLNGAVEEEWIGEEPGRLPWWPLGRPPKGEEEDPEEAVRRRRGREEEGLDERPVLDAEGLVVHGSRLLGIEVEVLRSRRRSQELAQARELLVVLGVERYRLKLQDLARALGKSPDGMTKAVARAARRRTDDDGFRRRLDDLDRALTEVARD